MWPRFSSQQGEPYFRQLERMALGELLPIRHVVVATGGGTFVEADNRALMLADGAVAWLDLPLAQVIERVPGRWPPAACLRPRADGAAVHATATRLRPRARADRRRSSPWPKCRAIARMDRLLMQYEVPRLSDVHANLEALEATLAKAGPHDGVLVLGDLVGYGADPNAVIERIRQLRAATIIRGNHDKVGAGIENVEAFNHLAKHAITWTAPRSPPATAAWLAALPAGPVNDRLHGSRSVTVRPSTRTSTSSTTSTRVGRCSWRNARSACSATRTCRRCTSSTPTFTPSGRLAGRRSACCWMTPAKYLVNCGAVGQPRDGDPRAAFGMLDTTSRR